MTNTSNTFDITVTACVVQSLTISLTDSTQIYTLTGPKIYNTITVTQAPACNYPISLSAVTNAPTSLFYINDTASPPRIEIGVYNDLSLLSNLTSYLIPIQANITDPLASG